MIHAFNVAVLVSPKRCLYSAATPAAKGADIDVPEYELVPPPGTGATIPLPGAYSETQGPVLEVLARWSSMVELATTRTAGESRGASPHESLPVLPADVDTKTPEFASRVTAALNVA